MLFEPVGGASVNSIVLPTTVYAVVGSCRTLSTKTALLLNEPHKIIQNQ